MPSVALQVVLLSKVEVHIQQMIMFVAGHVTLKSFAPAKIMLQQTSGQPHSFKTVLFHFLPLCIQKFYGSIDCPYFHAHTNHFLSITVLRKVDLSLCIV